MVKKKLAFTLVPLAAFLLVFLSGCGSSMAGTYHGTSGRTTMTLSKDGSAGYGEIVSTGHSDTWHGKWTVDGNSIHIVLKSNSDFGFNLKGTIHDNNTFELPDQKGTGDNNNWKDETFTRSK